LSGFFVYDKILVLMEFCENKNLNVEPETVDEDSSIGMGAFDLSAEQRDALRSVLDSVLQREERTA